MKYFSLFSGIGGFEKAIDQAYENYTRELFQDKEKRREALFNGVAYIKSGQSRPACVGYSEIDPYAIKIYQQHFNHKNYGNITTIEPDELPEFDFLCGGFPCQSFSIAGKRKGFDDTRGTLFFDIARILKAKRPMFAVLENVKGLISHDGGKTLHTILASLQELGYYVNWEVHNAKDFGVPQNRERIFIVCNNIKLLLNIGQNKTITFSERIIEEWLFQLLLNNLKEVQKLQERVSKDWVIGYLLCQEINQNLKLSDGENIKVGTMPTAGSMFPFKEEEVWQNIDIWLNNQLEGDLNEERLSITLTAINRIIESKTYTYSQMLMSILLATVLLRNSSKNLWNEVLLNLTLIQEGTKYERINIEEKEIVITESGLAHKSEILKEKNKCFIVGHLRGTPRPEVFPIQPKVDKSFDGSKETNQGVHQIAGTLLARDYANWNGNYIIDESQWRREGKLRIYDKIAPTLNTNGGGGHLPLVGDDQPKIRKLTPIEAERLQGFPDNWTQLGREFPENEYYKDEHKILEKFDIKISDSQRYKTLGNAVTVNVVRAIIDKLLKS